MLLILLKLIKTLWLPEEQLKLAVKFMSQPTQKLLSSSEFEVSISLIPDQ